MIKKYILLFNPAKLQIFFCLMLPIAILPALDFVPSISFNIELLGESAAA